MTVKGRLKALHDPRNRAIAVVGNEVEIKYYGEMEALAKRERLWQVSATVQMGDHGTVNIKGGELLVSGAVSQHYHTQKMKIGDAVDHVTKDIRDEMGSSSKVKHTIYLDISIKRNKG